MYLFSKRNAEKIIAEAIMKFNAKVVKWMWKQFVKSMCLQKSKGKNSIQDNPTISALIVVGGGAIGILWYRNMQNKPPPPQDNKDFYVGTTTTTNITIQTLVVHENPINFEIESCNKPPELSL